MTCFSDQLTHKPILRLRRLGLYTHHASIWFNRWGVCWLPWELQTFHSRTKEQVAQNKGGKGNSILRLVSKLESKYKALLTIELPQNGWFKWRTGLRHLSSRFMCSLSCRMMETDNLKLDGKRLVIIFLRALRWTRGPDSRSDKCAATDNRCLC